MKSFRILLLVASVHFALSPFAVASLSQIKLFATDGESRSSLADRQASIASLGKKIMPEEVIWNSIGLTDLAENNSTEILNTSPSHLEVDVLLALAKEINDWLATSDSLGAVISHGPASLEETAYFLNLVVKSDKPVVVVGVAPYTPLNPGGPSDLYNAVRVAACAQARGLGVLVLLNNNINAAGGPMNSHETDLSDGHEGGTLGSVHADRITFHRKPLRRHTHQSEFDISALVALPQVDVVAACQKSGRVPIEVYIAAGAKGIVLTRAGSAAVEEAQAHGILMVQSKCRGACCAQRSDIVPTSGVLTSTSLNPRKTRILLRLALTKTSDSAEIQRMFNEY